MMRGYPKQQTDHNMGWIKFRISLRYPPGKIVIIVGVVTK